MEDFRSLCAFECNKAEETVRTYLSFVSWWISSQMDHTTTFTERCCPIGTNLFPTLEMEYIIKKNVLETHNGWTQYRVVSMSLALGQASSENSGILCLLRRGGFGAVCLALAFLADVKFSDKESTRISHYYASPVSGRCSSPDNGRPCRSINYERVSYRTRS